MTADAKSDAEATQTNTGGKQSGAEEFTIEDLAVKHDVPNWVMSGLKAAYNWGTGKELTDKEFLANRDAWLKGSMCRS